MHSRLSSAISFRSPHRPSHCRRYAPFPSCWSLRNWEVMWEREIKPNILYLDTTLNSTLNSTCKYLQPHLSAFHRCTKSLSFPSCILRVKLWISVYTWFLRARLSFLPTCRKMRSDIYLCMWTSSSRHETMPTSYPSNWVGAHKIRSSQLFSWTSRF